MRGRRWGQALRIIREVDAIVTSGIRSPVMTTGVERYRLAANTNIFVTPTGRKCRRSTRMNSNVKAADEAETSQDVPCRRRWKSCDANTIFWEDTAMLDLTVKVTALVTLVALASVIMYPG